MMSNIFKAFHQVIYIKLKNFKVAPSKWVFEYNNNLFVQSGDLMERIQTLDNSIGNVIFKRLL